MSPTWLKQRRALLSTNQLGTESLLDFIPRVSRGLEAPRHLQPYIDILERADREPIRAVIAAPPRHAKTESTVHALAWWLKRNPRGRFAYATYAQALSDSIAFKARSIASRAGAEVSGPLRSWREQQGAQVEWTSIGGPFTGKGVDKVLVIDDPVKDRADAESALKRARAWDWFEDVARTRVEPGASIIVMATRWHPDDLSGRLIKEGWQYINLKAIADVDDPFGREAGTPLWPEHRPLSFFEEHRRNAYKWASLFQGEPRPRSGSVFQQPNEWHSLPHIGRVGYGIDLAYTSKTNADYSVCIRGLMTYGELDDLTGKPTPKLYILDVKRAQVDAPSFTLAIKSMWSARRGPMRWYCATSELGSAQFVKKAVPVFEPKIASADKFIRAGEVAAAWNAGNVLVPGKPSDVSEDVEWFAPEWVNEFLDEVLAFTGIKDAHDDQVDALAALWDVLAVQGAPHVTPSGGGGGAGGGSRWDGTEGRGFG